jgi:tetratricopeptide (TPR) repeat protein
MAKKVNLKAKNLFELAYKRLREGRIDESILLYKRSIEIMPTAEAYTYLGWAYSWNGDFERAIEECKKAIKIDPAYGNPYNDIGAYLIRLQRLDEAIPWLKRALKAPRYINYAYPYLNLGKIYELKGQWLRALHLYQLSLMQRPDYEQARTAYDKLSGRFN